MVLSIDETGHFCFIERSRAVTDLFFGFHETQIGEGP